MGHMQAYTSELGPRHLALASVNMSKIIHGVIETAEATSRKPKIGAPELSMPRAGVLGGGGGGLP